MKKIIQDKTFIVEDVQGNMVKYNYSRQKQEWGLLTRHFAGGSYMVLFEGHYMMALNEYRDILQDCKLNENFKVFECGDLTT